MLPLAVAAVALLWTDLPPSLRPGEQSDFPARLDRIEADTERRVAEGEWDHLVYYLLQGRAFTTRPAIEPALSARQFVDSGIVPPPVEARLDDLIQSTSDASRVRWARSKIAAASAERVLEQYRRAMRFLYEKEWGTRRMPGPQRRAEVARLYQTRGHSSDTSPDSIAAVESGISVVRELDPKAPLGDVLVIGPGADFAPRTSLREEAKPRSYQLDRIRELLPAARVECIDVNPRVVESAGCAERVNILTARRDRRYDLIVVTNVLVYFAAPQLAFALANIKAMLKPGGFLLHNELRDELDPLSRALAMPVVHARTVRLGGSGDRPLFDGVVLHRLPRPASVEAPRR